MPITPDPAHAATYSPQDDKLRIYPAGRLDKETWDTLKRHGFVYSPKLAEAGGGTLCATWTPGREDAARELCDGEDIGDEDMPAEERAAIRAARFAGYGQGALASAETAADRYDAGPAIHAAQSQARAERAAARHAKGAAFAASEWSRAEYWQARTVGVISHAKYKDAPEVRHRRIKGLEADLRAIEARYTPDPAHPEPFMQQRYNHPEYPNNAPEPHVMVGQGRARYPAPVAWLDNIKERSARWVAHIRLRIAYEQQMLGEQGGTTATTLVDRVAPGWRYGTPGRDAQYAVCKVSKDRAGRLSRIWLVEIAPADPANPRGMSRPAEWFKADGFREPTAEEAAAWAARKQKQKAAAPKLVNLTPEAAQGIADRQHAAALARYKEAPRWQREPPQKAEPWLMTSAEWNARKARSDGYRVDDFDTADGVTFRTRTATGAGNIWTATRRVVVLTDKPQKPLPTAAEGAETWEAETLEEATC